MQSHFIPRFLFCTLPLSAGAPGFSPSTFCNLATHRFIVLFHISDSSNVSTSNRTKNMANIIKVAFITGAGSGIGRSVCQLLAKQGVKIVAADQHVKTAQETVSILEGNGHLPVELNVSDSTSVENAVTKATDHYSQPPTIVVNSAGITRDNFLLNLHQKEFQDVLDVNLKGTFLVTQTAVKKMIEAEKSHGASIINLGSIIGKVGNIGQCNYAASKAGVVAFTKSASMEFGKFGIRVNAVLPGFIETPMTTTVPDNVKQMFINRVPCKRMGKPEEVAEVICFLASDKSSYVNGTTIEVTGGLH